MGNTAKLTEKAVGDAGDQTGSVIMPIARRVVVLFFRRGNDLPPLEWALRMQAAVRQVDLVNQHVDAAQRTFDGVRVIHFDEDG